MKEGKNRGSCSQLVGRRDLTIRAGWNGLLAGAGLLLKKGGKVEKSETREGSSGEAFKTWRTEDPAPYLHCPVTAWEPPTVYTRASVPLAKALGLTASGASHVLIRQVFWFRPAQFHFPPKSSTLLGFSCLLNAVSWELSTTVPQYSRYILRSSSLVSNPRHYLLSKTLALKEASGNHKVINTHPFSPTLSSFGFTINHTVITIYLNKNAFPGRKHGTSPRYVCLNKQSSPTHSTRCNLLTKLAVRTVNRASCRKVSLSTSTRASSGSITPPASSVSKQTTTSEILSGIQKSISELKAEHSEEYL